VNPSLDGDVRRRAQIHGWPEAKVICRISDSRASVRSSMPCWGAGSASQRYWWSCDSSMRVPPAAFQVRISVPGMCVPCLAKQQGPCPENIQEIVGNCGLFARRRPAFARTPSVDVAIPSDVR
jgi:hypothetical protein